MTDEEEAGLKEIVIRAAMLRKVLGQTSGIDSATIDSFVHAWFEVQLEMFYKP